MFCMAVTFTRGLSSRPASWSSCGVLDERHNHINSTQKDFWCKQAATELAVCILITIAFMQNSVCCAVSFGTKQARPPANLNKLESSNGQFFTANIFQVAPSSLHPNLVIKFHPLSTPIIAFSLLFFLIVNTVEKP